MVAYLSIIVSLIGLVVYAISNNPKAMNIGDRMFWCGLLAFLLANGAHMDRLI